METRLKSMEEYITGGDANHFCLSLQLRTNVGVPWTLWPTAHFISHTVWVRWTGGWSLPNLEFQPWYLGLFLLGSPNQHKFNISQSWCILPLSPAHQTCLPDISLWMEFHHDCITQPADSHLSSLPINLPHTESVIKSHHFHLLQILAAALDLTILCYFCPRSEPYHIPPGLPASTCRLPTPSLTPCPHLKPSVTSSYLNVQTSNHDF